MVFSKSAKNNLKFFFALTRETHSWTFIMSRLFSIGIGSWQPCRQGPARGPPGSSHRNPLARGPNKLFAGGPKIVATPLNQPLVTLPLGELSHSVLTRMGIEASFSDWMCFRTPTHYEVGKLEMSKLCLRTFHTVLCHQNLSPAKPTFEGIFRHTSWALS